MLPGLYRVILMLAILLAVYQSVAGFDSEIVEAETPNSNMKLVHNKPGQWQPNADVVLVRPYNILEASCPHGYVLANKHCHKRVRGAATMH